jgi:hypothetical protein
MPRQSAPIGFVSHQALVSFEFLLYDGPTALGRLLKTGYNSMTRVWISHGLPADNPVAYPLSCGRQRPDTGLMKNEGVMVTTMAPTITALQAQAEANLFLSNHLPDRFMAAPPSLDLAAQVWRVPVLLAYPIIGPVGQTGEILVSVMAEEVVASTPIKAMKMAARALYEQHRDAIEAPVP